MEAVTGRVRTLPPACGAAAQLDSRCSQTERHAKVSRGAVLAQRPPAPQLGPGNQAAGEVDQSSWQPQECGCRRWQEEGGWRGTQGAVARL